jgi:ATP-dependent RNA helicase RhlE
MKFERYAVEDSIKKSLAEHGYVRPTDIQYRAIPSILNGEDVLAIAQTGTGKTAAFVIPVLHLLLQQPREEGQVSCLVLVPTRELALQIQEVVVQLGKYTSLKSVCVTGGLDQDPQVKALAGGADILVATPGRMFDLIYQKVIKITRTSILILDEADQMLDKGFYKDILDVKKFLPKKHQTLFFSATINEKIKDLAYSLVKNAIRIQISPKERISKNVQHAVAFVHMDDKRFFLERLLKENPETKVMVFVRTQVRAERVCEAMKRVGLETLTLHGGKDQQARIQALQQFKEGACHVLIATDVSARGIDIKGVQMVVNYDVPEVAENYVHRVGRTGRGMDKGSAISLCSLDENELLEAIESYLEGEIEVMVIKAEEYNQTVKQSMDAANNDWKSLMKEADESKKKPKSKKKK